MSTPAAPVSMMEGFEVTISTDLHAARVVRERIVRLMEERGYPPREVFGVRLALEEALTNAMRHGNHMDPSRCVRVDCEVSEDRVRISVEDEGKGFPLEDVPDPTSDENLNRPAGRGILLMRAFMSSVRYNGSGNCVVLELERNDGTD